MSLSKNIKMLKMVAVLFLSSLVATAPAFADEAHPGHDYPRRLYSMPVTAITEIDLTNNQLELSVNTVGLYGRVVKYFGVGWVTDNSGEHDDLLAYDSVSNDWSVRVFQNDDEDLSVYTSRISDGWGIYRVDAEVDLKENTSGELFHIVELEDGDKWISKISYADCLGEWTDGMSCLIQGYYNGNPDYYYAYYGLVPVEKKVKIEVTEPKESTPEPEPEEPTQEEMTTDESGVVDMVESPTTKVVENIMVIDSGGAENEENETEEYEIDLASEGPGSTTLEVPTLGRIEKETFDWWPYFLGGVLVGGGLTWFLVYIYNRRKLSFLR